MADFTMPRLGADMEEATLVEWRVRAGDRIRRGQVIAEVDTAKGVIEIECFEPGIVETLVAHEGETLPVGAVLAILRIDAQESGSSQARRTDAPPSQQQPGPSENISGATPALEGTTGPTARTMAASHRPKVTPLARRLAVERGVDISRVAGTGTSGEVTAADIEKFASTSGGHPGSASPADANRARLRVAIAAAMAKSKREIPHYYLQTPIDMSRASAWLEQENRRRPIAQRLLPVVMTLKALARALRDEPRLNGHWIDGRFHSSDSIHIGFAIAMKGGGLVAPAIHDVDQKSLDELMAALNDLIPRARTGPLRSSEMTDATITLTSLGDLGVASVLGVIYPPQVAIIGLGRTTASPWVDNGQLVVRPVLQASLSGDHRASDGQVGARLLDAFNRHLQNPDSL